MNKNEIILKVSDSVEWLEELEATLSVSAWSKEDKCMISDHVTEHFSELKEIGLEELQESDMYYYENDITKEEMIKLLKSKGFDAVELLESDL